jgi:hypothetical protein
MTNLRKMGNSTDARLIQAEFMVDDKGIYDLVVMKNDVNLQLLPYKIVFYGLFDFSILLIFRFINKICSS